MKTRIFTIGLLMAVASFISCKNNEAIPEPTPVIPAAAVVTDAAPTDSAQQAAAVAKDVAKATEKGEQGENEADEKNEKE